MKKIEAIIRKTKFEVGDELLVVCAEADAEAITLFCDDVASDTHRSGRTGRAGKKGTSISIIHTREKFKVRQIGSKAMGFSVRRIQQMCKNGELPGSIGR